MNTRVLLQISTLEYVMFLPINQITQARMQKRLKPELKGAKVEKKSYPKDFAVELGKLYRQDALAKGILMPVSNGRMVDENVARLEKDRTEFLSRLTELRKFMEERGLHKIMPYSHKKVLDILKENA
jgi:hypothetical protein